MPPPHRSCRPAAWPDFRKLASFFQACNSKHLLPPPRHRMHGRRLRGSIGSGINKHLNAIRKAGAGSLFAPTKVTNRVRAIAADPTQSSLTGGCFDPRIIRICTEFAVQKARPAGRNRAGQRLLWMGPFELQTPAKPRHGPWGSASACGRPIVGRKKLKDPHPLLRDPSTANAQTSKPHRGIYRFARRGAHATVKEVLKQAIAASNHWRIIRSGAAQHF
jgi:hypothetical protein